ncbi:MAG: D-glycero-beta-D-manno-heptose 1,7-bisphosphate 7-phosphatase [Legionellaceae bacterium]|nr:D-glycero-beta-D-manno-heptose 1,7-bisphosphate 7-phosphatase [Legionellaceae bacterium]
MNKLIILDRDGVINQDSLQYIKSPDEFLFLPGSIQAIVRLNQAGYTVAIATNQSGISRGLYDERILAAIHEKMVRHVEAAGGDIALIKHCPHMPDAGCICRKPQPGLLHMISKQLGQSLEHVIMVGDRITDILTAKSVDVRPMVVLSPMTNLTQLENFPDVPKFESLADCVDEILMPVCQTSEA